METKGTTKKEQYAENEQRREDLTAKGDGPRPSGDLDVDYPLTSPAASQKADRLAQDQNDAFAKPHPVGSNLATTSVINEPNAQSPEEFKETGGIKTTERVTDIEPQESGGTVEEEKTDETETGNTETTTEGEQPAGTSAETSEGDKGAGVDESQK